MKTILTLSVLCWLYPALLSAQSRYDVVIDEIMADPSPSVGLPANEWIELRNVSAAPVSLRNWRLADAAGQSGPMPNFILQPDSMVIVCTGSAAAAMSAFGTTITVTSFPSLDNDGDLLYLKNASGSTMHAVNYSADWYRNELKKEGGWTLEMINTRNPCAGSSNWKASTDPAGGTPGRQNASAGNDADLIAPKLVRAYTTSSTTILLVFDEPVDSTDASLLSHYAVDGGLVLLSATAQGPLFNTVKLITTAPMLVQTTYSVTATGNKDCVGNSSATITKVKAGLAEDPSAGEWIINEILFNPRSNAEDWVEFYNNSPKILDASRLFIASRSGSGALTSIRALSEIPFLVFPGDYLVATTDAASLSRNYLVKNPAAVLTLSAMPSLPDDEGTVVSINFQGSVSDEVHYTDNWHFKLLADVEGISLERTDPAALSQKQDTWHSAASTAGFGTPGYQNSQYKAAAAVDGAITILPKIFSPDNDGRDDMATLQYQVPEPGYVARVTIFDAAGRPVRVLVNNATLGLKGYWNWDGLGDKGNRLSIGTYIIFTEIFNLQGKKQQFKTPVILARKL